MQHACPCHHTYNLPPFYPSCLLAHCSPLPAYHYHCKLLFAQDRTGRATSPHLFFTTSHGSMNSCPHIPYTCHPPPLPTAWPVPFSCPLLLLCPTPLPTSILCLPLTWVPVGQVYATHNLAADSIITGLRRVAAGGCTHMVGIADETCYLARASLDVSNGGGAA